MRLSLPLQIPGYSVLETSVAIEWPLRMMTFGTEKSGPVSRDAGIIWRRTYLPPRDACIIISLSWLDQIPCSSSFIILPSPIIPNLIIQPETHPKTQDHGYCPQLAGLYSLDDGDTCCRCRIYVNTWLLVQHKAPQHHLHFNSTDPP